jgi:hypothetical protein
MKQRLFWIVMIVALGASICCAQVATGNIRGSVSDSTGGVLPNCSVTITHIDTGLVRKVSTNERGDFNAPSLPVGEYKIVIGLAGFQSKALTGLILQVDQTAIIPTVLEPGAVTQTLEVTAAAPVLDSQTSSLGQVIENKRIVDLPLNGRNPFQLGVLSGGAVAFQGLTTNLPILAGGGRHNANDILLDGVDDNLRNFNGKVGRAGLTYIPSVDAVEEFKVKTNSFSAEYGHSAGYTMNATIKSGSNQYHGAAYEFLRNDILDANNFVSNYSGKPKAEFRQNQFGATIGGPARFPFYNGHDKTFFFGDYEGLQIRQAATSSLLDIPPAVFRAGDFSSSPTKIYDPATRALGAGGVAVSDPFPGNVIPTSRLDPTALKFQTLIPAINAGSPTSVTRNYLATSPQSTRRNQGDVKIDHRLNDKNNLMGRVSISNQNIPNQGTFIYSPSVQLFNTRNAVLSDTHVFSPSVVNELRLGYNRGNTSANATMEQQANDFTAKAGLAFGPIFGFPSLNWNTLGQSQGGATQFSSFSGAKTNYGFENTFQYADNLSIIRGDHTFKTGVDIRRFRFDRLLSVPASGNYYFGSTYTANGSLAQPGGLPYADFLLGLPTGVTNSNAIDYSRQRDLYVGPYIQDDWKISRRLTLNIGFRYDLYTQPVDAKNTGAMFDPYTANSAGRLGILQLPGQNGNSRAIVKGHHNNYAPRIGLAYQAARKFVIRSAWGIFYSYREQNDQTTDMAYSLYNFRNINMPPVSRDTTITPPYRFDSPLIVSGAVDPQFRNYSGANPLSADVSSFNEAPIDSSKFPMLQQWNFSMQYELLPNLLVEGSYAGARGVHWVQRIDLNQVRFEDALLGRNTQADRPFNFIASGEGLDAASVSNWYNSANLKIERRFSHGFAMLANYTISHATDSGGAGISTYGNQANTRAMNTYNLRLDHGLSSLDIPQKLALSANYEIPVGRGRFLNVRNSVLNQVIGGWQTNGILIVRSGLATDVTTAALPPVFGTINRPDRVSGQPMLVPNAGFDQYFNPAAFKAPATVPNYKGVPIQTFGNSSRMVLRGPRQRNMDFSIFKDFLFGEKRRMEFRAESFNLSNTPTFNLSSPTSAALTVGNAGFGKLGSSQTVGRQLQFGLKLVW